MAVVVVDGVTPVPIFGVDSGTVRATEDGIELEVTYGRDTTPAMRPAQASTRTIICGNESGSAMSCNAFGTVATVRLQRDRSGSGRCATTGSWGLSDQSIWVAKGCYGDFELTYTRG